MYHSCFHPDTQPCQICQEVELATEFEYSTVLNLECSKNATNQGSLEATQRVFLIFLRWLKDLEDLPLLCCLLLVQCVGEGPVNFFWVNHGQPSNETVEKDVTSPDIADKKFSENETVSTVDSTTIFFKINLINTREY